MTRFRLKCLKGSPRAAEASTRWGCSHVSGGEVINRWLCHVISFITMKKGSAELKSLEEMSTPSMGSLLYCAAAGGAKSELQFWIVVQLRMHFTEQNY